MKKIKIVLKLFFVPVLLIGFSGESFAGYFLDIASSHPRSEAIEYVREKGIFEGYEDRTFRPYNEITRAELIKVIVLSAPGVSEIIVDSYFENNFIDKNKSTADFSDVPVNAWYARYIAYARAMGWVEGYNDNAFKPKRPVSFVEALKMIMESNGSHDITIAAWPEYFDSFKVLYKGIIGDDWYTEYLVTAYLKDVFVIDTNNRKISFLPGRNLVSDKIGFEDEILRGDTAELLYRFGLIADNGDLCFTPPESGWALYEDEAMDFSFKYPAHFSMEVHQNPYSETDGEVLKRIVFGAGNSFYAVNVFLPFENESLKEYINNRDLSEQAEISVMEKDGNEVYYFYDYNEKVAGFAVKDDGYIYMLANNLSTCFLLNEIFDTFDLTVKKVAR